MTNLSDKNILVTGGTGSIGLELVRKVLNHEPRSVRVLDTNEEGLFELQSSWRDRGRQLRFLLGNVRDRDRLEMAMEDVDIVFHAAALKHVELNEYNPFEAVQTNVQGTQNVIRKALDEEVESVITISTDKASNPISVMGSTKLLAERLTTAANTYKGGRSTQFGCVRFGNVLGSSGSVVPIFLDQLKDRGPLTITDPEMTRFMIPIEDAVDLVLDAHQRLDGGEVFILKMPAFRVGTLADAIIEEYASAFGYRAEDIKTKEIGPRPGERKHEKLVSFEERRYTQEEEEMFKLIPQIDIPGYEIRATENSIDGEYTSEKPKLLSKEEIVDLIEQTRTISIPKR